MTPITLEFHTLVRTTSNFVLQYQITSTIVKTFLYKYRNHNDFQYIKNRTLFHLFSWNHNYFLANTCLHLWNIVVPKFYRVLVKIVYFSREKKSLIIFDGPDIDSQKLNMISDNTFTASSFQVSILYLSNKHNIEIIFTNSLHKNEVENHHIFYNINKTIALNSNDLACAHMTNLLCSLKLYTSGNNFINISLISVNYSGSNTGYCKYGGLSVYDNLNTTKEVLFLCDNPVTLVFDNHYRQEMVSSTQSIFLIVYAYYPYSKIELSITMQPTACKEVYIQRFFFCLVINFFKNCNSLIGLLPLPSDVETDRVKATLIPKLHRTYHFAPSKYCSFLPKLN